MVYSSLSTFNGYYTSMSATLEVHIVSNINSSCPRFLNLEPREQIDHRTTAAIQPRWIWQNATTCVSSEITSDDHPIFRKQFHIDCLKIFQSFYQKRKWNLPEAKIKFVRTKLKYLEISRDNHSIFLLNNFTKPV